MADTIRTVNTGAVADAIFDIADTTLYAAAGGTITAYSVSTGAVLRSWTLGSRIGGMDITPDGRFLYAVERDLRSDPANPNSALMAVYKLNLTTGAATTLTTRAGSGTDGFFDIAALSNDRIMVTASVQQGTNLGTNYTLGVADDRFTASAFLNPAPGLLVSSQDRSATLYSQTNGFGRLVSKVNEQGELSGGTNDYLPAGLAISNGGSRIAVFGNGLRILDGQFREIANLENALFSEVGPVRLVGLTFNKAGTILYGLNAVTRQVYAIDMADYSIDAIYSVDATLDASTFDSRYGDRIRISDDGRTLSVIADNKLQLIDATQPNALRGDAEANRLIGSGIDDGLYGYAGDDYLDGGAGADVMLGGSGNDTYVVDNAGDLVIERFGGGTDTIITSIGLTVSGDIERLQLAAGARAALMVTGSTGVEMIGNDLGTTFNGQGGNDIIRGFGGDDLLAGFGGEDQLYGGDGNDFLAGGSDIDLLSGGAGRDLFQGSIFEFMGDTITDIAVGDTIRVVGVDASGFTATLSGSTLTMTDGANPFTPTARVTLPNGFDGRMVVTAAAQGVDILFTDRTESVRNDFNGDGRADILWRNTLGTLSDWLGTASGGFTVNDANALVSVGTDWRVAGTGDFNGDGRSDILWRNANGALSDWLANSAGGFVPNDANALTSAPTSWQVAEVGDFNGDGRDDILWRNADGSLSNWLANSAGGFAPNDANALVRVGVDWNVAGAGDFNGDGRDDILWRNNDGTLSNWLANANGGFTPNDGAALSRVGTNWNVAAVGDFNGDGRDDILWRNDDGSLSNWLATATGGFSQNDVNAFSRVPNVWQVETTGDYNGDGRDDILWRNQDGTISNWLATAAGGFTPNDANALAPVPTNWQVQSIDHMIV